MNAGEESLEDVWVQGGSLEAAGENLGYVKPIGDLLQTKQAFVHDLFEAAALQEPQNWPRRDARSVNNTRGFPHPYACWTKASCDFSS